jgi:hypothetical protein
MHTRNLDTRFKSAILCGCAVLLRTVVGSSQHDDDFDTVIEPTTAVEILSACAEHAHLASPADLYEELRHFHGTKHSPDTCMCSLYYVWDDRVPQDERVHTPMAHPKHTKRCVLHAEHEDHVAHYEAVTAHNRETAAARALDAPSVTE